MNSADSAAAVYYEDFTVRYSETDYTGALKIRSVLDYLQQVAGTHAGMLGVGWEVMNRHGLVWVLSRLGIAFERTPVQGEKLTVKTYPNGFDRIFARRQFEINDGCGRSVAMASSLWLALDIVKMRPVKVEGGIFDFPGVPAGSFFPDLGKLAAAEEMRHIFTDEVRNSRIDLNGHLNNAEYAALLHDALHMLTGAPVRIKELRMNFTAAQKEGAAIDVHGTSGGDAFRVGAFGSGNGECFQAEGRLFPCAN